MVGIKRKSKLVLTNGDGLNNTRKKINEALECHSDFLLEVERSGEIKI